MNNRLCFPYVDENQIKFFDEIKELYDSMLDDISKKVFTNRIMYSITNDQLYMKNILLTTKSGIQLNNILTKAEGVYCYGAGIRGNRLVAMFPEAKWKAFIDRKLSGNSINDLKIVDLKQIKEMYISNEIVVISNLKYSNEIKNDLIEYGIGEDNIIILNDFDKECEKSIYLEDFMLDYIGNDTNIVDAGSFDGKDALRFINLVNNYEGKIFAFEPDNNNLEVCKNSLNCYTKSEIFNVGLGEKTGNINMSSDGEMSHISGNEGDIKIEIDTLDNILGEKRVDFIKMDIEGFELSAIKGARKIITEQKPVMAISVYHKATDVLLIPKLLLEYNSKYRFYMRHYSVSCADTVLYAL